MKHLLRCRVADSALPGGSGEVIIGLAQIVFALPHPEIADTTLVRMTGEANVMLILAPFKDVADEIERLQE